MNLQTFQKSAWNTLFTKTIYPLFAENNFEHNGVLVSFEPENASAFLKTPVSTSGSIVQTLRTKISFSYNDASAEVVKNLITMPVLSSNGLIIKDTKWCLINTTSPASGWYLRVTNDGKKILTLNRNAAQVICIGAKNNTFEVSISHRGKKDSMSLMAFLKAISGNPTLRYSDIMETLEDCSVVSKAYYAELKQMENKGTKEPTTSEAATQLLNISLNRAKGSLWNDPISELQKQLKNNYLRIGNERIPRFKNISSFACALQEGVTVALPIHTKDVNIDCGGSLTEEAVRHLDADDSVNQIVVSFNNNIYTLQKFTPSENITYEEVCFVLRVYDRFCNGLGKADDPDEYNNKIIKSIKEYYEEYISIALYKYVTKIKTMLTALSSDDVVERIIQEDFKSAETPLEAITDKINKSSYYQQLDDTNSLAAFEQEYKLTTTAKNVSNPARDIHSMQYGRVCPYTTPESKQVGLNLSLSVLSEIDDYGFITTPLLAFKEGVLDTEPVHLSAIDEMGTIIAPASVDLEAEWREHAGEPEYVIPNCRVNGEIKPAFLNSITHQEVSKVQSVGPLISTVPSAERDAGKRLIMSAAAQRQALPTWKRERPFVTTGMDAIIDVGIHTAKSLMEAHLIASGVSDKLEGTEKLYYGKSRKLGKNLEVTLSFAFKGQNYVIKRILNACTSTIKGALRYMRCAPANHIDDIGSYYDSDDIVFYNNDIDLKEADFNKSTIDFDTYKYNAKDISEHGVAIGSNVKVMFKSFAGYTYEDSIVVNEDFLMRQGLTVIKTTTLKYVLNANQRVEYDSSVLGSHPQLDSQGYPISGFYVQTGQPVLAVATEAENKTVKYSTETLQIGQSGFIMSYTRTEDHGKTIIRIALGEILPVTLGDKIEGLHGNKGVIGRIVPAAEMSYTEDGEVADILLNPLGILARSNLGQIIEFTLGAISSATGKIQLLEPFSETSIEAIAASAADLGLVEKDVYDGKTGLKYEKKAMIGNMYMLRLEHTNTSKFNATSNCSSNINARTMQPAKGAGGGQRMSELCTWCMMSYDATDTLSTLFTAQSDDVESKQKLDKAIRRKESTDIPITSSNIELLRAYFYMMGVNIAVGDQTRLELLTQSFIDSIAQKHCVIDMIAERLATPQQILHDPNIYDTPEGPENDHTTLAQLPFKCKMIMPIFLHNREVLGMVSYSLEDSDGGISNSINRFTTKSMEALLTGAMYISTWSERVIDPDLAGLLKESYGLTLPRTYSIPVLAKRTEDSFPEVDSYGIRAVVSIFENYNVLSSISQALSGSQVSRINSEEFPNLEKIILFAKNYSLSDFVVKSMIIPPAGYRQISERDKKMSNPIDAKLVDVVGAIKNIAAGSSDKDKARWETNLYRVLETITLKDLDADNPSLRKQLSDHRTKTSIMRDTLLAKRMSYTGRSVITIGPDLEFGECGIPISMLSVIFDEHIVVELADPNKHYLIHTLADVLNCEGRTFYRKAIKFIANNNIEGFRNLCMQRLTVFPEDAWSTVASIYNTTHKDKTISIKNIQQVFDMCYQELKDILIMLLKEHPVALNREPSLHKFNIQGFNAIPIDSFAIQLHPLNCRGYNGDFDGDQMAAIVPMHKKGIEDMRNKMMSVNNMIDPKDGSGIIALNQDMILGLYYATIHKDNVIKYETAPDICMTYYLPDFTGFSVPMGKSFGVAEKIAEDIFLGLLDVHDTIRCFYKDRMYIAEAGRILTNALLPNGLGFTKMLDANTPFDGEVYALKINYVLTKKTIDRVTNFLIEYFFAFDLGRDDTEDTLGAAYNRLMYLGFKMADFSGITLSIFDFTRLPVKSLISDKVNAAKQKATSTDYWYNRGFYTEESHADVKISTWSSATKSMKELLKEEFTNGSGFDRMSNIFMIIDSGARGDIYQLLEMSGLIGIVTNSSGNSLETPILASYMDGLSPSAFFLNAYTSRRQTVAAQLTTADAGEFNRKCIYLNDHIVIRSDDERCDGKSLWIKIKYSCIPLETVAGKTLVLEDSEIDAIPEEVIMQSPLCLIDTTPVREQYRQLCANIRGLLTAPIYDDTFAYLLQQYNQSYFFAKDSEGNFSCIEVEFKMSEESKRILKYRVMDIKAIDNDENLRGYANMFRDRAAKISGRAPDTLGEDVVIGDDILKTIETACIKRIPIFTIIGCHSTQGICRCCFGLQYDTHKFPNFGEHVGYQAVQAIGNPITQMILDSHKSEFSNEQSAKDKLEKILKSDSRATPVSQENRKLLPFATEDNMKLSVERVDHDYVVKLTTENSDGETFTQTRTISDLKTLQYPNNSIIQKGENFVNVPTELFDAWLYYAPAEIVQLDVWGLLCECFKNENILARNFEVFAKSLTEFGVAEETDLEEGIIQGYTYRTDKLRANNIAYHAAFESREHALARADKVLAGVAFADPVKNMCDAILRGVENNKNSNVGTMLLGTYEALKHKRFTHSVISEQQTNPTILMGDSKPEYTQQKTETVEETISSSSTDSVSQQLLDQLDVLDTHTKSEEKISEDTDTGVNSTSFFTED